ncbi:MAG TPA: phosphoglycerate dehydrogenase [Chloroflexota bacterium]
MSRILVVDPIAEDGIEALKRQQTVDVRLGLSHEELLDILPTYEALVVRSETKVTAEVIAAGQKLQVIGRAGVGVDNIDVEAATARGIVVVNAPSGNTIAVAEHTLGLIIAAARNITQASAALKGGRWSRAEFMGVEIRGRTLGVMGLGRIGTEVARRAVGFEMDVIALDPYIPQEHASRLGVQMVDKDTLLKRSDFLSLHAPATQQTAHAIGADELAQMKPTAWIVNCARGSLIDEAALLEALDKGTIGGAALDVFSVEPANENPLVRHPRVIATPHLAASTQEAQTNVAVELAEQLIAVLEGRSAPYAVNAPMIPPEVAGILAPFISLAQTLGNVSTQLAAGQTKNVELTYTGEIAEHDTSVLRAAVIRGLLESISDEPVNLVNAAVVARKRGLHIGEQKSSTAENFTNLITVKVETDLGTSVVGGTLINGEPHIVRIDDYWVNHVPTGGQVVLIRHVDRPGMIGKVGTILGEADINISSMQVGRARARGPALMLLSVDDPVSSEAAQRIQDVTDLTYVKVVRI